jgi:Ca2+-binding RTX toxin-like protein
VSTLLGVEPLNRYVHLAGGVLFMRASLMTFTFTLAAVFAALMPAVSAHAAAVTCDGVRATIVGTGGSDVIHGTSGRDVIAGLGGSDTIYAGGGNDLVCGGYGADRLYGGSGRDTLFGGRDGLHGTDEDGTERIGDTLRGGRGNDRLYAGADNRRADNIVFDVISWDASAHGVHIDLRSGKAHGEGDDIFGGGTFSVVGSSYGDVIEGTGRRDRINAGPGPDVVRGRGGADIIVVDTTHRGFGGDADQVWGGDGADRITAGRGDDRLSGGAGPDWIEDRGHSNDLLIGGPGDDTLTGEIGDTDKPQNFSGGRGVDTLELYSDAINGSEAASTGSWDMASGAMTFQLDRKITLSAPYINRGIFVTFGTAWTVSGTDGPDSLSASATAQTRFDGLAGDDVFLGSDGDDVFNGGPGLDHALRMGDGDDTCTSVERIDVADCEHVS